MRQRTTEVLIKKYSNRRLYDTSASRYITLDELADIIRGGRDVRVVDAKSNEDLTQITLAQLILENGRTARLLPLPLLTQLVRMSDDALAEFFGRYMTWALELYQQAKSGAQAISPFNPFATLPFAASNALARMWQGGPGQGAAPQTPPPPPPPAPEAEPEVEDEAPARKAKKKPKDGEGDEAIATLRRELAELKRAVMERGK